MDKKMWLCVWAFVLPGLPVMAITEKGHLDREAFVLDSNHHLGKNPPSVGTFLGRLCTCTCW